MKSQSSKPSLCSVSWRCACMGGGADIVIKSTTACMSSPHSPLICQPRSDDLLCKYMQNIWIRPLHTLSSNFLLFHTLGLLTLSPHTPSRLRVFPFQRWSKTNYINCSAKSFKMITADGSVLCWTQNAAAATKQTLHGVWEMREAMWGRGGVYLYVCVEKSFSLWFMPLSRLGYESGMMLHRAALQIMLAHLKRADLCSLSGSTSIFFFPPPPP